MKRFSLLLIALIGICTVNLTAQENNTEMELLKTKQKLLEAELKLLKNDQAKTNLAKDSLDFLYRKLEILERKVESNKVTYVYNPGFDSIEVTPHRSTWEFNFFRLFEGSIEVGYERMLTQKDGLDITIIGTYADQNGIGQRYVNDYYYEDYDDAMGMSIYYEADKMYGGGLELKWKRYLLAGRKIARYNGWKGLYIAPSLMYRMIVYDGSSQNYDYLSSYYKFDDFTNTLHIGKAGFYIGNKFVAADIIAVDCFIGGAIRFSQYSNDDLNDYSNWVDLDYTGIMPVAGVKIGVVNP